MAHRGVFLIQCCERRRGLLPGGVLICSRCDYKNEAATVIPNENQARDVPDGFQRWWHPSFDA